MTNILAAIVVSLVTNVTHADNAVDASPFLLNQFIDNMPIVTITNGSDFIVPYQTQTSRAATERTETTTITEIKALTFKWLGKSWTVRNERVLSRKVRTWRRRETWEEAK